MASGLRARLAQMSTVSEAPPKPLVQLSEMTCVEHAFVADERLYALNSEALARMGFEGEWPGIERILFLDTETTGLSRGAGTIAFMIGLGYVRDGAFLIEQHMVGDYPDEPVMLEHLSKLVGDFDVIVSFNGRTFDVPLLESRAVMNRMPPLFEAHSQLDLMYPSKRLWKRRIGSCRLGALETQILCSGREDDLPGSEAPKRFFDYLKTGDVSLLDDVLKHNRLDIASLGALLIALCDAYATPDALCELPDLFSMGRAMERLGERDLAARCYQLAAVPRPAQSVRELRDEQFTAEAAMALAMMKKRAGDMEGATEIWQQMARRNQMGALPLIELAKWHEHAQKRCDLALEWALASHNIERDETKLPAIDRRIQRLRTKLARIKA